MDCAYEIPSLLQLAAEKVAIEVNKYKSMHQYLTRMQLPKIFINYIENNLNYKTCDFPTYIKENMENSTVMSVVPSVAKGRENNKYKVTVGSEKVMYISTIFDLGIDMLKLDFPEGDYELFEFYNGYVLKTKEYTPKIQDVIHVFSSCDSGKGFKGTYPRSYFVEYVDHLRIFNQFIGEYLGQDWWEYMAEFPSRRVVSAFPVEHYCNWPVLFYLTEKICVDDLSKITLTYPSEMKCGNVQVCWCVFHSEKGRIGIAVQQDQHYYTMGGEVGACLFVSNGFRAIGNIEFNPFYTDEDIDVNIFVPHSDYVCEFEQCFCDYKYDDC